MSRNFAVATILFLTAAIPATAADSLTSRVHKAAVTACTPEASPSLPASHYRAIADHCVSRISQAAMSNLQARALAKTQSSTAALGN